MPSLSKTFLLHLQRFFRHLLGQCEGILALEHGRIAEDGTHRGLLAPSGTYARLWQRQSGGFLTD